MPIDRADPAIMVIVGTIIVGILFTTVIPKVTQIFESMNVVLPIYTRVLQVIYKLPKDLNRRIYVGQQMDLFIEE